MASLAELEGKDYANALALTATQDVSVLLEKRKGYGDSWLKRGGVGAFMMAARKWDRIENICNGVGYDVFEAGRVNIGDVQDDIADLRRYLCLIETEIRLRTYSAKKPSGMEQPFGFDAAGEEVAAAPTV